MLGHPLGAPVRDKLSVSSVGLVPSVMVATRKLLLIVWLPLPDQDEQKALTLIGALNVMTIESP
jgi:hypothetical protein